MLCWREFNPVQCNRLLKITASSQTTSLDSFTLSPPSGCCRSPLQWSPAPSRAQRQLLLPTPHHCEDICPQRTAQGLLESFTWAWQKFSPQLPPCSLPSCSRSRRSAPPQPPMPGHALHAAQPIPPALQMLFLIQQPCPFVFGMVLV